MTTLLRGRPLLTREIRASSCALPAVRGMVVSVKALPPFGTATMSEKTALAPDVPTSTAWQKGRRVYVRCGYNSPLNTALRHLGAHWDGTERALWTGSTKKAAVIELVRAREERKKAVEDVKAAGRWVHIPYDAHDLRARAKARCAVYDGDSRKGWWAMRTDEALAEMQDLVTKWRQRAEAARKEEERAHQQRAAAQAAAAAEATRQAARSRSEQLLADSGRTPTGEMAELHEISTRRMTKAAALDLARTPGSLVRLADGRRGIIVDVQVWFTDGEMASSVCWHPETHDQAHWDFQYTVAVVEPADAEREQDAQAAAEREDAAALNDLIEAAADLTAPRTEGWTHLPEEEQAGQITVVRGVTRFPAGTLTLTRDGQVRWQHPGYYDSYIATEGTTSAPAVVDRVRRLITAGNRERSCNPAGQQPVYFTVTARKHRA